MTILHIHNNYYWSIYLYRSNDGDLMMDTYMNFMLSFIRVGDKNLSNKKIMW